jgi:uncharacterized protein YegL
MPSNIEELLKGSALTGTISDMPGRAALKSLLMIFIVDNSGSMRGARIDKVNDAFRTMIPALQKVQMEVNNAFELSIAVMTFGSNARWIVTPTRIIDYHHTDIEADGGGTEYGTMLKTLEEKLSHDAFMAYSGKIAAPYIMLMTDGKPNDHHYEDVIDGLKKNLWYSHSQRYAVLIGHQAIYDSDARAAVEAFVSDPSEGIVTAEDAQTIVETVSAKTIHTVRMMTNHAAKPSDIEDEAFKGTTGGDSSSGEWNFPDADSNTIYGGNYVF